MKIFLAVFALVACAAGEEWTRKNEDQLYVIANECIKENNLTPEQVDKVRQKQIPNEEATRKYFLCKLLKIGIFSHDHSFNSERMAKQYNSGLKEDGLIQISLNCVRQSQKPGKAVDLFVFDHRNCFLKSKKDKIQKNAEDLRVSKFFKLMYAQESSIALEKQK